MNFSLLDKQDKKFLDRLLAHHGGAGVISQKIKEMRDFSHRKKLLAEKGYLAMIEDAEKLAKSFAQIPKMTGNDKYGKATSQVSGWQGAKVTHHAMQKIAASASTNNPCYVPSEFISVVALTDNYINNGDLMATLTMAENIMGASKFCSTNLITTPQPKARFADLAKVCETKFEIADVDADNAAVILKNQGTFFGNFGGIEIANDNHLIYLDGVTRTALATGGDFYLNPSWSSIIAACYYCREIPNIYFKVSMLLATQNTMQFRMLLNIIKEYLRSDGTSPIYEINIGNAASAETFIKCAQELDASGIKGISLAAHMRINPDLGMAGFDWTDNAMQVLKAGVDMTYKYESDGKAREMDTMEAYFMSEADREIHAEKIGDVIYYKSLKATEDGKAMIAAGIQPIFADVSY